MKITSRKFITKRKESLNMERKTYVQSELLKMGWTKKLITTYLPEPEYVKGGMYGKEMKVWQRELVNEVMEKDTFKNDFEKIKLNREKRKASTKKAVETKTKKLMDETIEFLKNIEIEIIDNRSLERKTYENKKDFIEWKKAQKGNYFYIADPYISDRDKVNYIRHNLTGYDDWLNNIESKVGKNEVYVFFKNEVLKKIAKAYPEYAEECDDMMCYHYTDIKH